MTHKDYELIAHQLWLSQPIDGENQRTKDYWFSLVHNMAMALQRDNPNFKADKFVKACEDGLPKWR
jgi:hypothetical protein